MLALKKLAWSSRLLLLICTLSVTLLTACSKQETPLRIASNVWPGYELSFLAREKAYFSDKEVRLVEVPSSTVCMQSLAAGNVEGAFLTLDEVLTAKAEGMDLKVIAVLDISMGADVVMASPSIKSLKDLKGKRIGVEESAVGAVMLDAVLEEAGLKTDEVKSVYMTVNEHLQAYKDGKVDALVTFEPVRTQLLKQGAKQVYDSSRIPGRVIDVIAVLPGAIKTHNKKIKKLVAGHFKARQYYIDNKAEASEFLSKRLKISPAEVPGSYEGLILPDLERNAYWMKGNQVRLEQSAQKLNEIMRRAKLLRKDVDVSGLVDPSFL